MQYMTRYFELMDDRQSHSRWHLGSPVDEQGQEIDPWQFKKGQVLDLEGVPCFPLQIPGRALDYCWAAFSIPVVHERVVHLFEQLGVREVQFIPARVEAHEEPYFILNALRIIRCIDDARCAEVRYWKPEDNRPDKLGEYRVVSRLRIDPAKVGDARVFRPWGWRVALIISEDLKQAMEAEGLTGTRFVEV
ncbi:imm11 family protein [Archangium violaceum]|uniref:imm11 family protein n=1 Tax=Archangium violaceum TaxID=83451 RepID=UPI0031B8A3C8